MYKKWLGKRDYTDYKNYWDNERGGKNIKKLRIRENLFKYGNLNRRNQSLGVVESIEMSQTKFIGKDKLGTRITNFCRNIYNN